MALAKKAAAAANDVNFGSLEMYVQGGGMPEGDYSLEFTVLMFQAVTQAGVSRGPSRLGVQISATPLNGDGTPREQFYSMGSSADKSFAPDPDTGKGLVAVPGGPAQTLNNQTNWAIFLKSLYDAGLPQGIFQNDLSVLDGIGVHMANVPEPQERSSFVSKTGEAEADRRPGTIAIVTEIKEDMKPWEGAVAAPAPKAPARAGLKAAVVAPAPKAAAKAAPKAKVAAVTEEDVEAAALAGVGTVLEANPNGVSKLLMRTGTFKAVTAEHDDDMANAVISTYFDTEDNLNLLLGQHGYVVAGPRIVPA